MTSWLVDTFQMEPGWARGIGFFLAVAIVLGLISVFVWVLRRIAGSRSLGSRSRQPRIAVMDAASLDARRRLVLIRRDNVEHLLLVGGPSDVVVEQNIVRGVPISQAYPRQPAMGAEMPAPYASAEIEPQPVAPTPQQAAAFAPAAPAQPPMSSAGIQISGGQAAGIQTSGAQTPAAPQPAPRRPLPPAAPAPRRPAEGGDASPLKRAGASVAAAGAAVAGLARSAAAPRGEAPAAASPGHQPQGQAPGQAQAPAQAAPRPEAPAARPPMRPLGGQPAAPVNPTQPQARAADVPPAQPRREPPPPPIRRNVTPPSSGPAANARTAFPQFTETAEKPATDKPAPRGDLSGVAAGAVADAATAAASASAPAAPKVEVKQPEPDLKAETKPAALVSAASRVEPDLASLEDALLAELGQSRGSPASEGSEPRSDIGTRPASPAAAAPKADPAAPPAAEDTPKPAPAAPEVKMDAPVAAGESPAKTDRDAKDGADAGPKAAKETTKDAGSVTMDAIEEEMARLLSEIGGPRK